MFGGWRQAVGGCWRLAVGVWWRFAVGGWRLVAVGGWQLVLGGRYTHRAHRVVHRARTALTFLPTLSCIFHIFSGWQGRGGLRGKHTTTEASTPSSSPMVVVAAHTPCQGRAVGRGRRGCRTLRYGRSTGCPSLWGRFERFAFRCAQCTRFAFRSVTSWGAQAPQPRHTGSPQGRGK